MTFKKLLFFLFDNTIYCIIDFFLNLYNGAKIRHIKKSLGHCDKSVKLEMPESVGCPRKIYLYERVTVHAFAKFIISPIGDEGRFIMKKYSGAAQGLTVITGNHSTKSTIGIWLHEEMSEHIGDVNKDIVVEDDAWIGSNVTLLSGVTIGRGAIIGAGCVVSKDVPPYAIAVGNPLKIIRFKYNIEEIIEHEKNLYDENERISIEELKEIFAKYKKQ